MSIQRDRARGPAWFLAVPGVALILIVAGALMAFLNRQVETRAQLQCRSATGNFDSGWVLSVAPDGSTFEIDTGGPHMVFVAPAGALCRIDTAVVRDVGKEQIHVY